jgi:hypothetical protein
MMFFLMKQGALFVCFFFFFSVADAKRKAGEQGEEEGWRMTK